MPGNRTVDGFDPGVTRFGQAAKLHVVFTGLYVLCLLLGKNWSYQAAFYISAVNIAWMIANFLKIPKCDGGICPEKQPALFIILITSLLMLLSVVFIDRRMRVK